MSKQRDKLIEARKHLAVIEKSIDKVFSSSSEDVGFFWLSMGKLLEKHSVNLGSQPDAEDSDALLDWAESVFVVQGIITATDKLMKDIK